MENLESPRNRNVVRPIDERWPKAMLVVYVVLTGEGEAVQKLPGLCLTAVWWNIFRVDEN